MHPVRKNGGSAGAGGRSAAFYRGAIQITGGVHGQIRGGCEEADPAAFHPCGGFVGSAGPGPAGVGRVRKMIVHRRDAETRRTRILFAMPPAWAYLRDSRLSV